MKDIINPYGELAFAVCLQAVDDYRRGRRWLNNNPKAKTHYAWEMRKGMSEAEEFIRSATFDSYSGLDGQAVLKRLKCECDIKEERNI